MGKCFVKVRDDHEIVELEKQSEDEFCICSEMTGSDRKTITTTALRRRIEPWLTALFQSEHLSLLVGSGFSSAIQSLSNAPLINAMTNENMFSCYKDEIYGHAINSAEKAGRKKSNIEDVFRSANDLIQGLSVISQSESFAEFKTKYEILKEEYNIGLKVFAEQILGIENSIMNSSEELRVNAFNYAVLFLLSFASRTGTRDRLNIFSTNYDRVIESVADIAGLRLMDRFVGSLSPIFRSSRLDLDYIYNPPGMRGEPRFLEGVARFTKLHGSLDWVEEDREIRRLSIPFGVSNIDPFLFNKTEYSKVMIFPNSSKDRETSEYPYVELFRDFAAALCRPNSTIVTYGYSFGDDHVNRVIRDMLTIPSTHLVIINYNDESGRIMDLYNNWGRKSQTSLIIGEDIASLDAVVNYCLPKPAIDRTTLRMNRIIQQRLDSSEDQSFDSEEDTN